MWIEDEEVRRRRTRGEKNGKVSLRGRVVDDGDSLHECVWKILKTAV